MSAGRPSTRFGAAILLFILGCASHASPRTAPLPGDDPVVLGSFVEILEDRTAALDLADVRSPAHENEFKSEHRDAPNFGFTDSAYWLRFRLRNETPRTQDLILEVRWPNLDRVELFAPQAGGAYRKSESGDTLRFREREIKHRNHAFALRLAPQEAGEYYVRISTQGTLTAPLYLWRADRFFSRDRDYQLAYGLFYGLTLALILYNALLFATLRDRTYLYYVLYGVALTLYLAGLDGLAFEYLWPESTYGANNGLMICGGLALAAASRFISNFLGTAGLSPRADIALKALGVVLLAFTIVSVLGWPLRYSALIRVYNVLGAAFLVVALTVAVSAVLRGYRPARYLLFAWATVIAAGLVFVLRNISAVPHNFFTSQGVHIGFALDLILLSFALGDRFKEIKRAAKASQEEARALELAHRHEQQLRGAIELEERKSQLLLSNVFPRAVIPRLRAGEAPIADQFADVTVVFIDIEEFTPLCERLGPKRTVLLLNDLFARFDEAAQRLGVEKIETTGDGYLAAAGAPQPHDRHPEAAADFALAAIHAAAQTPAVAGQHVRVRIGLHTGPVFGGVVGESRFHYKIFGETVNVASRVQSQCRSGRVLISEPTAKRLRGIFGVEEHAVLELKGHGPMKTFWLLDRQ